METVNTNLKSCLNDQEVVVKSRTTKVVDKSRKTTLVSPKVQGAKKKRFVRTKKIKPASMQNKEENTGNVSQQSVSTVVQTFPTVDSVMPSVFPQQSGGPPIIPFVHSPATPNTISNPYTQQVFVPAFIPVEAANANVNQPLAFVGQMATPVIENVPNMETPQLTEISDTQSNRFDKVDEKYHSSELDYFLGGTAQLLEEMSRRKRSRSFSSLSSLVFSRSGSGSRKHRRRYSPRSNRSFSRSSFDRYSLMSYDRYRSRRSRRRTSFSRSRSNSFGRSRSRTRSRSLERSWRSLSPRRAKTDHKNRGSRSPISEDSFRGSFVTVSEADSRDSIRSRDRDRSYGRQYSPYHEDRFSDLDSLYDFRRDSLHRRYSDRYYREKRDSVSSQDAYLNTIPPSFGSETYRSERHHRHHYSRSHTHKLKREELEGVSDLEDISDFEVVSELEDISDSDTTVTWQEGQSRSQSRISGTYYETVSDNEDADPGVNSKPMTYNVTGTVDNETSAEDGKYDGYLDPRIEKSAEDKYFEEVSDTENENFDSSPVKGDVLENVSDNEMDISAGVEENVVSSAPLSEQTAGSGLVITVSQDPSNIESKEKSRQEAVMTDSEKTDDWQAVSKSAIQVYENLGLLKDENNKLIYIGQGNSGSAEKQSAHVNTSSSVAKADQIMTLDESLQGYIDTLWQFPHKGILYMGFPNFTDESEAYKDELIAEIIHIILSLDLPYVTLNKLLNVIRERVQIKVYSCDELRQILALYPKHFVFTKHAGSDTDDDDSDPETSVLHVNIKVQVRICERHKSLPFSKDACPCSALHICPFHLLRNCSKVECSLGHDLRTQHNANVLKEYRLHRSTLTEIVDYLRNVAHRGVDTVPSVCKFYNRRRGCSKESESDDDEMCTELHLCFFYAVDNCRKGTDCELTHSIMSGQPLILLQKFGLDPIEQGEFNILSVIRTFLRIRRQELETLHDKMSSKTLTENEVKLCIAKGINPKVLQLKNLIGQPVSVGESDTTVAGSTETVNTDKQDTSPGTKADSLKAVGELDKQTQWTTKSVQMRAQKALIEKALKSTVGSSVNKLSDYKAVIPLICKFYNNDTGCARSNEMCEFIHVCHYYVMGDCKFKDRCKRSHDITSGQPQSILSRLGLSNKSEEEVITLLQKLCGETLLCEEKEPVTANT